MRKKLFWLICLLAGITSPVFSQIQLGAEKVLGPEADLSGKEIAIQAASGYNRWIKIGSNIAADLTEDLVLIAEYVSKTPEEKNEYVFKGKLEQKYIKEASKEGDFLTWTSNIEEAARFTIAYADNVTDEHNVKCPAGVDRSMVIRIHTTYSDGSQGYINSNGGNKPKFAIGRGAYSALLIYDATNAFQVNKVYQLSFHALKSLDELTTGKEIVIRNCFVDGERGDRSGYLHMATPKMTITKGMNTVAENSIFTVNTKTNEGKTQYSFQNNATYIPNDGNLSATLAPSTTEAFYEIIPDNEKEGCFNFKSPDKELYMNANVGELVFWNASPHPYQFYSVEEVSDFELKTITWKYVDTNSDVEVKTVEKPYYTNTYPIAQDLKAEVPAGFEIISVDGTPIEEIEQLENVSDTKTNYTIAIQKTVTLTDIGYGTLYSDVALSIPEGIIAYTGTVEGEKLKLTKLNGIIPANTAVILNGAAGNYIFQASAEEGTLPENNSLQGALTNILKPTKNNEGLPATVYTLQNLDNGIGFYKYTGTHMQPCKAYLLLTDTQAQNIRSLTFETEGTTSIKNSVVNANDKIQIYDLQGRRINQIKQNGIYILNGKKVWLAH